MRETTPGRTIRLLAVAATLAVAACTPLRTMIAQPIITNQSRQVVRMQTWDCQWYRDCRRGLINHVRDDV